ncbi:MAG: metallophosphoesterase [Clostridia bacterium]|nr:metallophosphoesterase [Clostridia bacterium]
MGKTGVIIIIAVFLTVIILLLIAGGYRLKKTFYSLSTDKVSGHVRFALITDLHSCRYGRNMEELVGAIASCKPDYILLGGDIYDHKLKDTNADVFLARIAEEYPCFYVSGNHEYYREDFENLFQHIRDLGITVLEGEHVMIGNIALLGARDPYLYGDETMESDIVNALEGTSGEMYRILLSHRPEKTDIYGRYDIDLVLSGHAHGGQWRIPGLIEGVYAPHQGLLPKITAGVYELANGKLIVSKGLARETTIIPRLFNNPEIVIIDIN